MSVPSAKPTRAVTPAQSPAISPHGPESGDPALLLEHGVTPMKAVNALYSEGDDEVAEAIVASLRMQVFGADLPKPSNRLRRWLAGGVFRLLERTTRTRTRTGPDGREVVVYQNRILESSGHPYALTLLEPSGAESASFVEGGDPMNAPYMMISPEISRNAGTWDKLLLDSVQAKDVQLRFIWETRSTYEMAKRRLDGGEPVRLKAVAAGTGLSLILVFDRLVREGHDPGLITAAITDRDAANVEKTRRLLDKLAATRDHHDPVGNRSGISARVEDLLQPASSAEAGVSNPDEPHHIVTLVGILEYFSGFTCATTEEHLGQPAPDEQPDAADVIRRISAMTVESGSLITNTYRVEIGARILEVFGKQLRYRNREDLHALAETVGFTPASTSGSGNIYDVEVFKKITAGS